MTNIQKARETQQVENIYMQQRNKERIINESLEFEEYRFRIDFFGILFYTFRA